MQSPLRVVDINNFFSATGGGVRRYHLEKLQALSEDPSLDYHVIVPSDRLETERYHRATIHHVPAVNGLGSGYRFIANPLRLRALLRRIQPDVIEVGSPYVLPDVVRVATRGLDCAVVGFWHAHYPVAYVHRPLARRSRRLAGAAEKLAWWWARRTYGRMDRTLAAAGSVRAELRAQGVTELAHTPLGVDLQLFTPDRRDARLRDSWGATADDVVMAFPHRLCEEKNLSAMVEAYEQVRTRLDRPVKLVIAGRGPEEELVQDLAARYPRDVHYLGYLPGREDMARLLASVDVVAALSPTETFGLSAAEAMAAGNAIVGSEELSIGEMLRESRAGVTVADGDARAIAEAWCELLQPGRARLLGARAHSYALQHFSWARTFEHLREVYEQSSPRARPEPTQLVAPVATSGWGAGLARLLDDERDTPKRGRLTRKTGAGRRSA